MISNEVLWKEFAEKRDPALREQLVLQYTPLVKFVVNSMSMPLPRVTDMEDIMGYGIIGLVHAVDRFDPSRGVKFETYAIQRIRGSMIDALRDLNVHSRSTIAKIRGVERSIDELIPKLQRYPSNEEVAEHMHLSVEEVTQIVAESNLTFVSLDRPMLFDDGDEGLTLADTLKEERLPDPDEAVERQELRHMLVEAIGSLTEREKLVLSLYYIDEVSPLEIAEILGISRSRIYQLHAQAILRLRALLRTRYSDNAVVARDR